MVDLCPKELAVMLAIAKSPHGASLDTIASRMGYRPARSGRLAIRKKLRAIMTKHGEMENASHYGESGKYIGRLTPRDQWDNEKWFLTTAGRAAITAGNRK